MRRRTSTAARCSARSWAASRVTTLQLRTVTRAHPGRRAATAASPACSSPATCAPVGYGSGFGALKEVRAALGDFKASGKPVMAYLNAATTRDYYLASAASDLVLDPYGMILLPGLASQPLFMAGAFEKFGVGVQVTRVGKYKSAVEPYTRKDLSPEAREDLQKLLDDIWGDLLADIGHSRGFKPGRFAERRGHRGLFMASDALAAHLVDRTAYRDEVIDELKLQTGRKKDTRAFKQINLRTLRRPGAEDAPAIDGRRPGRGGLRGGRHRRRRRPDRARWAAGSSPANCAELRQDDDIKAIVLRVNSPGGSATASEEIQRELRLTLQTKPVVVSMGSVAASGGYWISTYADRIFAEPTTITGSIGVFGLFINVQQLANNLGFTWDTVKTGQLAGMLTISRPKTDAELAVFQRMVDWIYDQFTDKVAEARKLDKAKVLEIAQGRVWSGAEAKKIGLVDEIGGLSDAVVYAAKKAGLGTRFRIAEYPRKRELKEIINEIMKDVAPGDAFGNGALKQMLGEFKAQIEILSRFNDPHGVYARLPVDVRIQ